MGLLHIDIFPMYLLPRPFFLDTPCSSQHTVGHAYVRLLLMHWKQKQHYDRHALRVRIAPENAYRRTYYDSFFCPFHRYRTMPRFIRCSPSFTLVGRAAGLNRQLRAFGNCVAPALRQPWSCLPSVPWMERCKREMLIRYLLAA